MESTFWQAIVDSDYCVPAGLTVASLTPELIAGLGSSDPYLRDNLVYDILTTWIGRGGYYTPDQLRDIGNAMVRSLSYKIGEYDSDSVFLRSFSALILGDIVDADTRSTFLSTEEMQNWLDQILAYLPAERDLRGYVPVKGWAHAIAHSGDLVMKLARSRHFEEYDLQRLLQALADRVIAPANQTFLYLEDERLAKAAIVALQRDLLNTAFLSAWIERMANSWSGNTWASAFKEAEANNAYQNTRMFLRSLYFQLLFGIRAPSYYPDPAPFEHTPAVRDAVLAMLADALKVMDLRFYKE